MVEVGDVCIGGSGETHVDCVGGLVVDDFRYEVHSIGQLTAEHHHLVAAVLVPHLDVHVIVLKLLDEILQR